MKTLKVKINDPILGKTFVGEIHKLKTTKTGLLGKIAGTNYNVFRPWTSNQWFTNVTSSCRFNIETECMTQEEIAVFVAENK